MSQLDFMKIYVKHISTYIRYSFFYVWPGEGQKHNKESDAYAPDSLIICESLVLCGLHNNFP